MGNLEANDVGNNSRKYNHPFEPYDIQIQLMDAIYDAIDNYKIGLFESPTGTGKTLSLICSSMTWLREYKRIQHSGRLKTLSPKTNQNGLSRHIKRLLQIGQKCGPRSMRGC